VVVVVVVVAMAAVVTVVVAAMAPGRALARVGVGHPAKAAGGAKLRLPR